MKVQARKLIQDALRKTGYIAGNKTPSAADAQMALEQLQYLMDSWKLESLLDICSQEFTCLVQPGQQTVSLGPQAGMFTADMTMDEPPTAIKGAYWTNNTNLVPLAEVKDVELWRSWRNNNISGEYPKYFWYNPSYPVAHIEFYPLPAQQMYFSVGASAWPSIPQTLDDYIEQPPAWISALMWNLASVVSVDLPIPSEGPQLSKIESMAAEAKARIKRARLRPTPRAIVDPSLLRGRYSSGGTRFGYNVSADSNPGIS